MILDLSAVKIVVTPFPIFRFHVQLLITLEWKPTPSEYLAERGSAQLFARAVVNLSFMVRASCMIYI